MRKLLAAAALAAAPLAGVAAHDPADRPPWEDHEDWRLIAFAEDGSEALFLAKDLIRKAGNAASLEVLVVSRVPDKESGTDQRHEHYLVDCGSLAWKTTAASSFKAKGILPPTMFRSDSVDGPPDVPEYRTAFETACGKIPWNGERIADPYRWAKARLGK